MSTAAASYRRRVTRLVNLRGESLTFASAGAKTGLVVTASAEQISHYFATAPTLPAYILVLDSTTAAPAATDTTTRDGRTLTVRVVDRPRLDGSALASLVVLT